MFSTSSHSKLPDYYSPSAIRGDMMKLQQLIHKIHNQFDQVSRAIPDSLPSDLSTLTKQMQILNKQVEAETKFDYPLEITTIENKINKLEKDINDHEINGKTKLKQSEYNENSLTNLEQKITASNNLFLEQLHTKIEQKLKDFSLQQNSEEQKTIDFTLSANFPSLSEEGSKKSDKSNEQIIQIETTSTLDPKIHLRVQRHSETIRLVEDDFDSLLTAKSPILLPKMQLQLISSISGKNEQQIKELENNYSELESSLGDIKQENIEKKNKMNENQNIEGAIKHPEFTEFTNRIFKKFNDVSNEISCAEIQVDNSVNDLEKYLDAINMKINDFKQSASDFESLIRMTDKKLTDAESKKQKKSKEESLPEKSEDKLKTIEKNGEKKIKNLSKEIKSKINDLKKAIDELKAESKANKANPYGALFQPPVNPLDE